MFNSFKNNKYPYISGIHPNNRSSRASKLRITHSLPSSYAMQLIDID